MFSMMNFEFLDLGFEKNVVVFVQFFVGLGVADVI